MEEQIIKQTTSPRVTLNKLKGGYSWTLACSEGETLTEVIDVIEQANKTMVEKFKNGGFRR